jgi:tRNA(fMet)-specific endonuclease VapC
LEELEAAKGICVDTDVLIDFLKKKEPGSRAYEKWRNKRTIAITSITAFELLFGASHSENMQKRYEEARSLIEQQHVLPFDKSAANKASKIGIQLQRLGKGIEIRDLFNASICVSQNIPMLTRNKNHYERVAELELLEI